MSKCRRINLITPPHNIILERAFPSERFESSEAKINVDIVYQQCEKGFGNISFNVKYEGFKEKYPDENGVDLGFSIPENCMVYIRFADNEIWQWSTEYYAITTKKNLNKKFRKYNLDERTETVSFQAKRDDGLPKKDYFTINVEILQANMPEKWLPVSIDPWVLNPRPIG